MPPPSKPAIGVSLAGVDIRQSRRRDVSALKFGVWCVPLARPRGGEAGRTIAKRQEIAVTLVSCAFPVAAAPDND